MKPSPRTRRMLLAPLLACGLALCPCRRTEGQTPGRRAAPAESKQAARKRSEEARRRAEVREAVAVLFEAAEAARSFEDLQDKVWIQVEAADILWPFDEQSARALLSRAWEAVTAPGVIPAFRQAGDENRVEEVIKARHMVIARAVRHDSRLAEGYLKELFRGVPSADAAGDLEDKDTPLPRQVWRGPSVFGSQRLEAADTLLYKGDYKSAALLAAPVINEGVSRPLVDFIIALRTRAPQEGDALFLRLLERTRTDAEATANDVLLLSKPIVSPHMEIFIDVDGSAHLRRVDYVDEALFRAFADAPALVRRAFYTTAAAVLLRPLRAGQESEATALYFAAGRLLPFFEREAPQFVPPLRARMEALSTTLAAGHADSLSSQMNLLSLTPKNPVDPLAWQLEEVTREADAQARDRLRLRIVESAARRRLWERARTIAADIEDDDTQRTARRVIALYQVMGVARAYEEEAEGFDRAAEFVRAADVPHEFRAAGLAQAAELAARGGKSARAAALLDEALLSAAQASEDGGRRLTALTLVAQSAVRFKAARTWEVLAALVRQANATDDPSSVNLQFEIRHRPSDESAAFSLPEESLSFEDPFVAAARLDFTRTLTEARSLEDKLTRALVNVSIARTTLEKEKRPSR